MRLFWFVVALVALNLVLAMGNAWPTPLPRVTLLVAADLAGVVVVLAALAGVRGGLGRTTRLIAAAAVVALAAGRYGVVTTAALFGRPINLYWEAQHVPDVMSLAVSSVSAWQLAAGAVAVVIAVGVALAVAWLGVGGLARGFEDGWMRRISIVAGVVVLAWPNAPTWRTEPVVGALARQVSLVVAHQLTPRVGLAVADVLGPPAAAPRTERPDVLLVFFESYGETVVTAPELAARLEPVYGDVETIIAAAGWQAATGWLDAATFAGASWLSHTSVLSGAIIADQRDYLSLLDSDRALLTDDFRAAGYRSVALVPGIQRDWPEGAALRFDAIYDAAALSYPGERIGWWGIPDQYSLAFLADRELTAGQRAPVTRAPVTRAPVFAMFPTVMSHMPFGPLPEYTDDWDAALEGRLAQAPAKVGGYRTAYGDAVAYNLETLAGFLASQAPDRAVVVAVGDHQPAGLVSGPGASWRVPVHVFAKDAADLAPFMGLGLTPGVRPVAFKGDGDAAGIWSLHRALRAMTQ